MLGKEPESSPCLACTLALVPSLRPQGHVYYLPVPPRSTSHGEHHVYLPLSPSPKPELTPLGGESGDQLSHLQYHPPPGHLGPALSPRGTLLASCPVAELPLPPHPTPHRAAVPREIRQCRLFLGLQTRGFFPPHPTPKQDLKRLGRFGLVASSLLQGPNPILLSHTILFGHIL